MGTSAQWRIEAEMIAREYPSLLEKKAETAGQSVTVSYSGMPGGGTATRTTENAALRSGLLPLEERKLNAVEEALAAMRYFENADDRAKAIELLHFRKKRFRMDRVCGILGYSFTTVRQWNTAFLAMVWSNYLTK